ncbi:MAG: DUF1579 family protein [Gammaproteobacteria bacterium]
MKQIATAPVLVLVLGVAAAPAMAEDKPGQKHEMSAEQKAMMEAWEKAAKPGPQHQWLASKAGKWRFTGKFWMDATKPPTESTGTVERELMLGGRVLAEKVTSTYMDKPFEGYGLTGYDNVSTEFWGTWNDNMSTGIMLSTGQCDDKGACTHSGSYMDAMTNAKKTVRMTSRDEGPDREVHQFFEKGPDGKEFKSMELAYTRSK